VRIPRLREEHRFGICLKVLEAMGFSEEFKKTA
jgi:hypothetical protein